MDINFATFCGDGNGVSLYAKAIDGEAWGIATGDGDVVGGTTVFTDDFIAIPGFGYCWGDDQSVVTGADTEDVLGGGLIRP